MFRVVVFRTLQISPLSYKLLTNPPPPPPSLLFLAYKAHLGSTIVCFLRVLQEVVGSPQSRLYVDLQLGLQGPMNPETLNPKP